MRIRAYVDGLNLYYGGRSLARGAQGWKWLDLRSLLSSVVARRWPGAALDRVVYCTTRIDAAASPSSKRSQDVYLLALRAHGAVDWIEYGKFYAKTKTRPLATRGSPPRFRPQVTIASAPIQVRDAADSDVPGAYFMATVADREEKGSDVNVASHLLIDALSGTMDGAVVVSNADLRTSCSPMGCSGSLGIGLSGRASKSRRPPSGESEKLTAPQSCSTHQTRMSRSLK